MRASALVTRVRMHTTPPRASSLRRSVATVVLGALVLVGQRVGAVQATIPEAVVQNYLRAVYARDYAGAYEYISLEDRKLKSRDEYLRESGTFSGAALEMARTLAALIRFEDVTTVIDGDRATVAGRLILPNANDPVMQDLFLEFDEERLDALSPAERQARVEQVRQMAQSGRLPVILGENERWELLREQGSWRVFLNWAGAVVVRFGAATKSGLPWEFTPVQPVVRAKPGETMQNFYRVKNVSDRRITGKARHVLDPPEETGHLEIVTCFCFLQQTLDPGEEQELPVVFRVSYEVPDTITEIRIRYEFYPIDQFPPGELR